MRAIITTNLVRAILLHLKINTTRPHSSYIRRILRLEGAKIIFTWDNNSAITNSRSKIIANKIDAVMVLALHPKSGESVSIRGGARRAAGYEAVEIPWTRAGEWHTWIAFISDDRENISDSQYLGIVNVEGTRPNTAQPGESR